ncbi:MAG TPA: hypothetical protein PLT45_00050 [Smithella sp.]|nr:hypothetical protein [Smithella sp.]
MLTHTYFLQNVLEQGSPKRSSLDIYVYNIMPDLLTIHPKISANKTHAVKRDMEIPLIHSKVAFTFFHLLVDDLAHYGRTDSDLREGFDADSQGYCYIKGRDLVGPIVELHGLIDREISNDEAVYQSHLIIEMMFDLIIARQIEEFRTIDLLVEALQYTADRKLNELSDDMNWLYGFEKGQIADVMQAAIHYVTREGMDRLMNIQGRINLYQEKFGLHSDEMIFSSALTKMFEKALTLIDDEDLFLQQSIGAIQKLKEKACGLNGLLHIP